MKYQRPKGLCKVCFITTVRYDMAPRAIRECNALSERYRVEVIEFDQTKKLPEYAKKGNIEFKRVAPKSWPASRFLKLFFLMSAMIPEVVRSKADAYHSFGFIELFVGATAKILNRSKLIYDSYEVYPYQLSGIKDCKTLSKSFIWSSVVAIENILLKVCDAVLVVPSFKDELFHRFKSRRKPVFTVWNVPTKRESGSTLRVSNGEIFKFLYAGRISKDTGALVMLRAFRLAKQKFSSLKLILVGRCDLDSVARDELLMTARKYGGVVLIKALPHDEVERLYSDADAGLALYPPTYWTFRTKASEKIFEYMSYSLPVITSDFPGLREIISTTQSGLLVNPTDPESVSIAILSLCQNRQGARLLGENGRNAVLNSYNWTKQKEKLFEAYDYLETNALIPFTSGASDF